MRAWLQKQRIVAWNEPLGEPECPYAYRWWLSLGPLGSLRLHDWIRSDDKRAKHDHPSDFVTLVLRGAYTDLGRDGDERMTPGTVRYRRAEHTHTVAVDPGGCWTLLWFGPKRRDWGFWTTNKLGVMRWWRSRKYFAEHGHHPCDQP